MFLYLIIVVGLLVCFSLWFGFIPPIGASTLIRVRKGTVRIEKGNVKGHAREHVSDILIEAQVKEGYIAVTSGNRICFSRQIPSAYHQRLRNVLLNQWT